MSNFSGNKKRIVELSYSFAIRDAILYKPSKVMRPKKRYEKHRVLSFHVFGNCAQLDFDIFRLLYFKSSDLYLFFFFFSYIFFNFLFYTGG